MSKAKHDPLTGFCERCGKNLALVGLAHNCRAPTNLMMNPEPDEVPDHDRTAVDTSDIPEATEGSSGVRERSVLKPRDKPKRDLSEASLFIQDAARRLEEGERERQAHARELQEAADAVPADKPKKRGRPKTSDPEERKKAARERMRKKRAEAAKK